MTTRSSKPRLRAKPDYIALGPIFPTTLKSMRFAPQGIPKITEWKKRIGDIPLVAIGGIKLEQAAEIFAAGADCIAVVSDVTQHADARRAGARVARAEGGGGVMNEANTAVIAQPDRATQYSRDGRRSTDDSRGVLDRPVKPGDDTLVGVATASHRPRITTSNNQNSTGG